MSAREIAIFCFEIAGTIAFASSGAVLAVQKRMDLFGVATLGVVTAVGGGFFRDLVLGTVPPLMFVRPVYTFVAIGTSLVVFAFSRFFKNKFSSQVVHLYGHIMQFLDTMGLGMFTAVGVNTAWEAGFRYKFLLIFVGMLTGVGGGLLRDLLAQEKPSILVRDVYAVASIAGAASTMLLLPHVPAFLAMLAGAALVWIIRALAVRYHWNLPVA